MNILFVNYGDFTTNSLNHIAGFANTLCVAGHACAVAVPADKETLRHIPHPLFIAATYEEALARPGLFPDGRPADVIHAWTPREAVRTFVLAYQRRAGGKARLIIHLEDNERFLAESYTRRTFAELGDLGARELAAVLPPGLSHPVRHETFLRAADGITHIVDQLREFAPEGTPLHRLFPGIDFSLYQPQPPSADLRKELGLAKGEAVIVFTGSNTFANEPEMRELHVAVALLNQRGRRTRLVRTGFNSAHFQAGLGEDIRRHVIDLGFVEKGRLPGLLALADLLVQPGKAGPFNDYRLPSKLPEFLAMGKPVLLPATNLAHLMEDGRDAIFLRTGTPEEIADRCAELLEDPTRRAALGRHAAAFARSQFDPDRNTRGLAAFYEDVCSRPALTNWTLVTDPAATDATLAAAALAMRLAPAKGEPGPSGKLALDSAFLAKVVRQVERSVATAVEGAEAAREECLQREELTRQHVANLEQLLASARAHAAALEEARNLTQEHAGNLERELVRHRDRRAEADVLLQSARQQATAYENALLQADAEGAALRGEIERLSGQLRQTGEELTATKTHSGNLEQLLRAAQEHATALEHARDLTQGHIENLERLRRDAEDSVRSRDGQIANLEALLRASQANVAGLEHARELTQVHVENLERLRREAQADTAARLADGAARLAEAQELLRLRDNHSVNLEHLLQAARTNVADLELALKLTHDHANNLAQQVSVHRQRREQADVLLQTARQQTSAYENTLLQTEARVATLEQELEDLQRELAAQNARCEQTDALLLSARQQMIAFENAILGADAEVARTHEEMAQLGLRFKQAQDEVAMTHTHVANLETMRAEVEARLAAAHAAHEAQLAAAADRLAQAEALIRTRDAKINRLTKSFSWQVTSPLRALRRLVLDRPELPGPSPHLIGNIDHPQDWSQVPPTLNVRGWTLHRERVRLRAFRASLGGRRVPAEFGLERLDVLDHFRDYPGAERSGWIVKVDVPRFGRHRLLIEAEDEKGTWHVVHVRSVRRTAKAAPPAPNTYGAWIASYDTITPQEAGRIRARLRKLKRRPLISVLMPTYNTPEKWLVKAIESVRQQLYENWELCIADDASKQPHVRKVLERYRKKDPRIKVVIRETNGHISAASNSALALAHGEFIALLDHDDELRPHALACVALELDAHPDADLVYSDEDKIDENGHRYDHYFKPDWNPDLFLVQNYISHLGVYRTLLVREVGGFRVGYEGSQDWDLAMRVTERTGADRIRHIPKILYHWRSVPGSTAMLIGAKSYATIAAEKVINEHLQRTGSGATISPTKGSYWRIHHPVPTPAPKVTLIIPTRNRLNVLRPCVDSLLAKTTYPNFEILIVDNDSDDPETLAWLEAIQAPAEDRAPVRVCRFGGEFNFSAINNYGVSQTEAPVIGLLNNDLEAIEGDWLHEMVSHAVRPEIGCVGAKLYYPDDRIQHAGVILGIGGVAAHAWQTHPRGAAGQAHRNLLQQNLSAVTAACLLIRREVYLEVGGLDEKLKVAFNDVDFCLAVRAAGYRNLWTPYAELYHHESASRGAEDTLEKRDRFRGEVEYITAKWGDALQNDPAYNPNLTLTINDFTLSTPPRPWPRLEA